MILATPAMAQTADPTVSPPPAGAAATGDATAAPVATTATTPPSAAAAAIGVAPMANTAPADFVAWSWDGNNFEIDAAKIALDRSKRPDVKAFAQQMLDSHTKMADTLKSSLTNSQRTFQPPAARLSAANEALLKQLRDAPAAQFDKLYLAQQTTAHQKA